MFFSSIMDWNTKVGSQEIPRVTGKFDLGIQNEAGKRLTEFCQENTRHSRHPIPATQDTWTSTDGQYRNKIGYILCI